jgi:hypothetical protein
MLRYLLLTLILASPAFADTFIGTVDSGGYVYDYDLVTQTLLETSPFTYVATSLNGTILQFGTGCVPECTTTFINDWYLMLPTETLGMWQLGVTYSRPDWELVATASGAVITYPAAVAEPSSLMLLLSGALALDLARRKNRQLLRSENIL